MESDSDRTIDSDELNEIIKESELTKRKSNSTKRSKDLKPVRSSKLHEISDSDSEGEKVKKKKIDASVKVKPTKTTSIVQDIHPKCKYGKECFRKNPDHLRNFSHTSENPTPDSPGNSKLKKIDSSNHHNLGFFLTKVCGIPDIYNHGCAKGIKDILSPKNGKLLASAQFNYMIDVPWLMQQYPEEFRRCPLTIVHGEQRQAKKSLENSGAGFSNIKFCQAELNIPFGTHHTKMMFLLYEEGFRVVIHTSNLVENDWFQKTQGMWISPILPKLTRGPSSTEGESSTNFKQDLLEYVHSYQAVPLEEWCMTIKQHDFSKIRVFLIGSTPGRHASTKKTSFGHLKLRKVLNLYGPEKKLVDSQWPLIGQFSSIGSLGQSQDVWMCGEFSASLATLKGSSMMNIQSSLLKLVFPSVENVRKSLEGYPAGASLPYSYKVEHRQTYLRNFLHQWKSEGLGRSEACPHIKTYLRVSPDYTKIAWFLVTSANLSKAAWGAFERKGVQLMIRSYELGVLFLPGYFEMEMFSAPSSSCKDKSKCFPVPFDIPLTLYSKEDLPWTWDSPHVEAPDRNGNKWCPS